MHRGLTVSVPPLRMWVHCPRASNGLSPRRSNLVGYVRWDAQSDQFPPCQTIIPTAFRSQSGLPVTHPVTANTGDSGLFLAAVAIFAIPYRLSTDRNPPWAQAAQRLTCEGVRRYCCSRRFRKSRTIALQRGYRQQAVRRADKV